MICLNSKMLLQIAPRADPRRVEALLPEIERACDKYNVSTSARLAAFIAQWTHETGEFHFLEEIWGPTPQQLKYERPIVDGQPAPFAKPGEPILVWQRLGNVEPGDGKLFRGRGLPHLTGRGNYSRASDAIGMNLVAAPELVSRLDVGAEVAGWFWHWKGLNEPADRLDFAKITLVVNGSATKSFRERFTYYRRACSVLGVPLT